MRHDDSKPRRAMRADDDRLLHAIEPQPRPKRADYSGSYWRDWSEAIAARKAAR